MLFNDAARIDLKQLIREHRLPVRMLTIGLPLTILSGALAALVLFDDLGLWPALVLGAILAPTDAALGQPVVSNRRVPVRIRQALNVESGLNDGIALPAVVILISCMESAHGTQDAGYWLTFTAKQLLLGPLVGLAIGLGGGKIVTWGQKSGWMSHAFQELSVIGMSLAAFSCAELVGGNGFIAAFVGGLTLGNTAREVCTCLFEFGEAEGQLMTLLVFLFFGATMVPTALEHLDPTVLVYAVASLTLVRFVPVMLSLVGLGLRSDTLLFLGWFGPRGIASILFALLLLEHSAESGPVDRMIAIVVVTVLLSTFLHGASAYPLAGAYAKRIEYLKSEREAAEHASVSEMPIRLPYSIDSTRHS